MYPHYALTGHLVYVQGGTLMAVPFDSQRLAVTGAAVPMVEGVMQSTADGDAQYSFSATGSLAYVPGAAQAAQLRLVWVNRSGVEQPLAAPTHAYVNPRISPDGRRVAVGITEQEKQVWQYDLSRETLTRLTFQGDNNLTPFWTPDGKRIVFISNKEGQRNLFWQLADGSGGLERLIASEDLNIPGSWSPDGRLLAFSDVSGTTGYDLWVLRLGDPSAASGQVRKAELFLRTPFNEAAPQFSPDGNWLAYVSDESGRKEIYVQPYPGPGGKWQISTEGGVEPLWNRNGRELFYRSGKKMMAVEIAIKPSFSAGTPKRLFEGQYQSLPTVSTPNYDVSSDGQRFLMLKPSEQAQSAMLQINVVENWFEELKRRAPAGTK
jgi:Tol biopolymer transport system component